MELVDFINPRRIVFLGDTDFVPQSFIDLVQDKYSVFILNSKDWEKNAQSLGDLLKQPKLNRLYIDYHDRMKESSNAVKQN
jgi:hypothetical protein